MVPALAMEHRYQNYVSPRQTYNVCLNLLQTYTVHGLSYTPRKAIPETNTYMNSSAAKNSDFGLNLPN